MTFGIYEIISLVLLCAMLGGLRLMNSPRSAFAGNLVGSLAMLASIVCVLMFNGIMTMPLLWAGMLAGTVIGIIMAFRVKMIQMPQMVAILNGLGGGASMLVGVIIIAETSAMPGLAAVISSILALIVGGITLSGSVVAAGKLQGVIKSGPGGSRGLLLALTGLVVIPGLSVYITMGFGHATAAAWGLAAASLAAGYILTAPVGGADMPVAISLLNSLSGLAASICGFALSDPLLVGAGAIVGSAGLILTQIMCRAMNRSPLDILTGKSFKAAASLQGTSGSNDPTPGYGNGSHLSTDELLKNAQKVVIIPGYGMAVAQAQFKLKELYEGLLTAGKEVRFAIHPVAGRMPGHMNVLLAEVDIPYGALFEMDEINPSFPETDLVIVVGACDVVNPAAGTAEGTPLYGMPVLQADRAKNVIVCNLDTKPGYSGVPNTLYAQSNTILLTGDAIESLGRLLDEINTVKA